MDWQDDAIVIARRKHGETSLIVMLLTRDHGLHGGLVRGGTGSRARATYQIGNRIRADWRARLEEHLGTYRAEPIRHYAAGLLDSPRPLAALGAAASLVETALPEREPNGAVFDAFVALLDALSGPGWGAAYARFELALLAALGFGLDLHRCAATGMTEDLTYVSPRTGRAVSSQAGAPYRERLLVLPAFLIGAEAAPGAAPGAIEIAQAMRLTGYFFERQVFDPAGRRMPNARRVLYDAILRQTTTSSDRGTDQTQ